MSKQLRVYREGAKTEFDYQILWEEDFTKLADAVKTLELSCGKICIVADDIVGNLYGKEVQKAATVAPSATGSTEALKCNKCSAPMKTSSAGKPYCSKLCWKNPVQPLPVIQQEEVPLSDIPF